MLHIVNSTSKIDTSNYVENIEVTFEMNKDAIAEHPEFKGVLQEIDHSTYIGDGIIKTKFGVTTINHISSGCKTLLLALFMPDYWIDFLDAGPNVFWALVKIVNKHDYEVRIVTDGVLLDTDVSTKIEFNGVIIDSKDLINVSNDLNFGNKVVE